MYIRIWTCIDYNLIFPRVLSYSCPLLVRLNTFNSPSDDFYTWRLMTCAFWHYARLSRTVHVLMLIALYSLRPFWWWIALMSLLLAVDFNLSYPHAGDCLVDRCVELKVFLVLGVFVLEWSSWRSFIAQMWCIFLNPRGVSFCGRVFFCNLENKNNSQGT